MKKRSASCSTAAVGRRPPRRRSPRTDRSRTWLSSLWSRPSPAGPREGARTFPPRRRPRVWTVWSTRPPRGKRLSPASRWISADFWLHPTGACGPLDLPFVVSFEPPAPAPPLLKYRAVRLAAGTDVVPSVECSVTAHRHSGDPAGRVLKVSLVHSDVAGSNPGASGASSFAMTRVSLVRAAEGSRLRLTPLGHPVDKPRIAAPGRGWDTILAMQTDDENADAGSARPRVRFLSRPRLISAWATRPVPNAPSSSRAAAQGDDTAGLGRGAAAVPGVAARGGRDRRVARDFTARRARGSIADGGSVPRVQRRRRAREGPGTGQGARFEGVRCTRGGRVGGRGDRLDSFPAGLGRAVDADGAHGGDFAGRARKIRGFPGDAPRAQPVARTRASDVPVDVRRRRGRGRRRVETGRSSRPLYRRRRRRWLGPRRRRRLRRLRSRGTRFGRCPLAGRGCGRAR